MRQLGAMPAVRERMLPDEHLSGVKVYREAAERKRAVGPTTGMFGTKDTKYKALTGRGLLICPRGLFYLR